ncbi:MAG: CYTH domain-containing protein [Wenzhouxiangella sp.]|jgi:adenylate cyclase|nr:CYTH domain-containing protein [Wenzhouxiangella sp.]
MALEIERKFLVAGDFRSHVSSSTRIVQGYLCAAPERTVRVRLAGEQGYLTIKGTPGLSGLSRYEWERKLPAIEATELLELCEPGRIDKVRHRVDFAGMTFEVDEFAGDNQGLVIAELELDDEEQLFERPAWLGAEVTGDPRYYNSSLIRKPYCDW